MRERERGGKVLYIESIATDFAADSANGVAILLTNPRVDRRERGRGEESRWGTGGGGRGSGSGRRSIMPVCSFLIISFLRYKKKENKTLRTDCKGVGTDEKAGCYSTVTSYVYEVHTEYSSWHSNK